MIITLQVLVILILFELGLGRFFGWDSVVWHLCLGTSALAHQIIALGEKSFAET